MGVFKKGQIWRLMDETDGFIDFAEITYADEKGCRFKWKGLDGDDYGDKEYTTSTTPIGKKGVTRSWWELDERGSFNDLIDQYYGQTESRG